MARPETSPNEAILGFYSGARPDHHGRYAHQIQAWSDEELEAVHDFIQWLFPLIEPSPVNPSAPVLDEPTIAAFRSRPDLQQQLHASFVRMLRFYGFEFVPGPPLRVEQAPNFGSRADDWLSAGNHNHLRITRIIKCLMLLGLESQAQAFFQALSDIYDVERRKQWPAVSATTFRFWQSAAEQTL